VLVADEELGRCRRQRGETELAHRQTLGGRFEIRDVRLDLRAADVAEWAAAEGALRHRSAGADAVPLRHRARHPAVLRAASRLRRIEPLRKQPRVTRRDGSDHRPLPAPYLQSVQTPDEICRPTRFRKLAVVDDVDPARHLLAHDLSHGLLESDGECVGVIRLARLFRHQQRHQVGRPRQAPLVRSEDAICAVFQRHPSHRVRLRGKPRRRSGRGRIANRYATIPAAYSSDGAADVAQYGA
jgi:hypothetical protein